MERQVPQQWLHGFLDLCLLSLLEERRDYGLGLIQRLEEAGLGSVPGGTLYPALVRLESQGYVSASLETSVSGPRRKYFSLSATGRATVADQQRRWHDFRDGIEAVVSGQVTGVGGIGAGHGRGAK